jgi:cob(I)alamin adenosyltransferase
MVRITKVYTRTGDDGSTGLADFSRTRKTDVRVAAYADVDETNSLIGVALAALPAGATEDKSPLKPVCEVLLRTQSELFDVGADLSTPLTEGKSPVFRVTEQWVTILEQDIDRLNGTLSPLTSFILPGGTLFAAHLHVARTVARRAERSAWAAVETHGNQVPGGVNTVAVKYLNRLSDLLFVAARYANTVSGVSDVLWSPASRNADNS